MNKQVVKYEKTLETLMNKSTKMGIYYLGNIAMATNMPLMREFMDISRDFDPDKFHAAAEELLFSMSDDDRDIFINAATAMVSIALLEALPKNQHCLIETVTENLKLYLEHIYLTDDPEGVA